MKAINYFLEVSFAILKMIPVINSKGNTQTANGIPVFTHLSISFLPGNVMAKATKDVAIPV